MVAMIVMEVMMEGGYVEFMAKGFFLAFGQKTQGPKNSNSRILKRKLKNFGLKYSRNRNLAQKSKFPVKIYFFRKFVKNSSIFPKLKPKISQKLKLSESPCTCVAEKNG